MDNVQYVRDKGPKICASNNTVTYYYNCNRSFMSRGNKTCITSMNTQIGKRLTKSQGSSKLDFNCTSQIKAVYEEDNKISVTYYETHYKHDKQIQHIRISKADRTVVANKLMSGVSVSKIIDSNRDNIEGKNLNRVALLTRKDVNNIKMSYGIVSDDGKRNHNDAVVDMFVEEGRLNKENNYVLYYKKQGVIQENDLLKGEDFCIIFMNNSQQLMLEKFGGNTIAIDSTHGLNQYDLELTTILVVDEYGEGFPAACMFSNRKDTYIFELFFTKIKEKIGKPIYTKTFMSDITNVFINAWKTVMGNPQKQIYCWWHVDKAWQTNLSKIRNLEKRKWVYQTLKHLQGYEDENDFPQLLQNAINIFHEDEETLDFGNYFSRNYSSNSALWARCYRKDCSVNTNMRLESMHRTLLKHCYLEGKVVKRLGKALHALLKFIRDKTLERIIKKTKGENNIYIQDIHSRHFLSLINNDNYNIKILDTNLFQVQNDKSCCNIKKVLDNPCCALKCKYCDICVHSFTCTCYDHFQKSSICKHIHFVCMNNTPGPQNDRILSECNQENVDMETTTYLPDLKGKDSLTKACSFQDKIYAKCTEIKQNVLEVKDEDTLNECYEYLKKASLILDTFEIVSQPFIKNKLEIPSPHNKKIEKQGFFSTKKNNKRKRTFIKKPNHEETNCISEVLLKCPMISRDSTNDHNYI